MSKSLPSRPDFEQLRKQAKELLKQCRLADRAAVDRVRQFHPQYGDPKRPPAEKFRLHDAQLVVARELGFASWAKLKDEVELRQKSFAERVDLVARLACFNQVRRVIELLDAEPELGRASFHTACAVGEADVVERALRDKPGLAVTKGGPDQWPPLLYACFSGFLKAAGKQRDGIVRIVKLLLKHGADPNSSCLFDNKYQLSALYAAAGSANHAPLTKLLLDAGADPNDGESLYHSAEFKDHACTRLLLEHGAKVKGSNAFFRKLDFDDLAGVRLFLDHGADPNDCGGNDNRPMHWAITNGRRVEFLKLLAERGADLRARNAEGLTPFQLASRLGHTEAAQFLSERGAGDELKPHDRFIAACQRANWPEVQALLARHPDLARSLGPADHGLLTSAAWRGNADAVRTMLKAGFNVAAKGKDGETALHCAAWMGYLPIVKILLEAGAPVEISEPQYHAPPLGWALHGSVNSRDREGKPLNPEADYPGIVAALLAAGVTRPEEIDEDLPEDVREVLQQR
jgi:ankyrin repeat protein